MNKADKIGHLAIMSRANVNHTVSAHMAEQFGYMYQLEQIAKDGGYIMAGTEEAIGMENSAKDLLKLAHEILDIRNQLMLNAKPSLMVVA